MDADRSRAAEATAAQSPARGRKPISDRAVLTGILFVLRSGISWKMLPKEVGCGSGTTCWRRLVKWQRAGVWKRLHRLLLTELRHRGQVDLARAVVDSSSLRVARGKKTGPNPRAAVRVGRYASPASCRVTVRTTRNRIATNPNAVGTRRSSQNDGGHTAAASAAPDGCRVAAPLSSTESALRTAPVRAETFLALACAMVCSNSLKSVS